MKIEPLIEPRYSQESSLTDQSASPAVPGFLPQGLNDRSQPRKLSGLEHEPEKIHPVLSTIGRGAGTTAERVWCDFLSRVNALPKVGKPV